MSLLVEIARCAAQGSQFIIASHSPILLAMPEAEILCFDADGVRPCAYEETDSYRIKDVSRRPQADPASFTWWHRVTRKPEVCSKAGRRYFLGK